jgi:RNA polymerase sigma-70 factor (sigma-E family)
VQAKAWHLLGSRLFNEDSGDLGPLPPGGYHPGRSQVTPYSVPIQYTSLHPLRRGNRGAPPGIHTVMELAEADEEVGRTEGGRLAELYVRHADDARRLAYVLTGDHALAEDLVQEAFVRLAGRFLDLRDRDAFPGYLRKTVVNLARMQFRRRRVERAFLDRQRREPPGEAVLPDLDTYQHMKQALLGLPARQRAAIVLRFYEDQSESQIADILGCRPGTVKSLLARGLKALREPMRGD